MTMIIELNKKADEILEMDTSNVYDIVLTIRQLNSEIANIFDELNSCKHSDIKSIKIKTLRGLKRKCNELNILLDRILE